MIVNAKKQKILGGITPDIFVKLDTVGLNKFYDNLITKKILSDFVFNVLTNRYSASFIEQNVNSFVITENDVKDFATYIQSKNIVLDRVQFNNAKTHIVVGLKAFLYRYYLGDVGYYKAINQTDNVVKQALINLQ